jgi:predicted RNA-binding protein YlxR (DUF448 family)
MLAVAQDSDLDRGATTVAPGMARRCALTREIKPVGELIRFVVGPGGTVVPDVKRKLPGRGLWLTGTRAALEEAIRRSVLARGFKRAVAVMPALAADTERLLARSALDALAIAGKAGLVVTGAVRVETALREDGMVALIHAADAACNGKRKLDVALRRNRGEKSPETVIVDAFPGEQLDLALNRLNVVHAALLAGPVSETFLARVKRLERFRAGN